MSQPISAEPRCLAIRYLGFNPALNVDLLGGQMREAVKVWWYLREWWYLSRTSKGFLVGFLPLLFLLASCGGGGGGGGGSGGGQGVLSVDLAFTPGDGRVTVSLVEKGPLVRLLNISSYQLTAIDSADETMRIEGKRLDEGSFNGSSLTGLINDHNYTFALRVFYFPVGSAELSNLSLRIDYAEDANAQNNQDAGGITIGSNWDEDYLADSVDGDDDNDGLDDVNDSGMALDDCPRGDIDWRSNKMTDNDGDGCRDAGEDMDDDNDNVTDSEDLGQYNGRFCRLYVDCDNDTVLDREDSGQYNGRQCRLFADCDNDTVLDAEDNCPAIANSDQMDGDGDGTGDLCDSDDDNDKVVDGSDVDRDGDGLIEIGMAAELDAVRWALDGSGRRLREMAALNQTGCGNGADRIACGGYELVRDISLAAYAGGNGWAPLGNDTDSGMDSCQGAGFSGVFEGNGFTVRDLNINRSGEDCIGLFGHLAVGTVIRNLTVRAEAVIGNAYVGGLVGRGDDVEIVSSSSVAGEVSGEYNVGGLVGRGDDVEIVSSSSVAGEVSGLGNNVGGLLGDSEDVEIVSSFSVAGEVRGNERVGGLVGWGDDAEIVSSLSVAGEVSGGGFWVGGLVGEGTNAEIASSLSVAGEVRGSSSAVGGLVGWAGSAEIESSYSVAGEVKGGSSPGGLVGSGGAADSSYWHTAVSVADNGKGEEKTLAGLRTPTNDNAYDASSIYANWTRGADIDGTAGVEDITIYCDEDLSGAIETDEMRDGSGSGDDNRIWDFGGTSDYPAIRCLPLSLTEQRSWWFINSTTNRPQLNQDRLDALTSP